MTTCKECEKRKIGCHATCETYLNTVAAIKKAKAQDMGQALARRVLIDSNLRGKRRLKK